jgi:hypothetical protein
MAMLNQAQLKQLINYDPEKGIFTRKSKPTGCEHGNGYVRITVKNQKYYAHRLAWFYVYGVWPRSELDRNKKDNRIINLRESNRSENVRNIGLLSSNTSGVKGVHWAANKHKWRAVITINSRTKHLGYFDDLEQAAEARAKEEAASI